MAASESNRKTNKKNNLNVGMLIFGVVLIYLIATTILYFAKDHITSYEVKMGKLSYSIHSTGVVLRKETIYTAERSGEVTFYASEADKVRVGSNLYSIHETSAAAEISTEEDKTLDNEDYSKMQSDIAEFQDSYDPVHFDRTYDFAYRLESELLDIYNRNALEQMQGSLSGLQITTAVDDGIIAYTIDGYEDLQIEDVNRDVLEKRDYNKKDIREQNRVDSGEPVYKLVTDETWEVMLPVSQEDYNYLLEQDRKELEVRIEKDNLLLWATPAYYEQNGDYYICLTFVNSMLRYLSDRYLDITLIVVEETGLKIPNTAITEKAFYAIPYAYISTTNGSAANVYMKDETGEIVKKSVSIYHEDEEAGMYYIDCNTISENTQLIRTDSQETYSVSDTLTLKGVYCINKGYAVFKQIREKYTNEEYTIIEEGTSYGISNYDFIALDSQTVQEDDIVY